MTDGLSKSNSKVRTSIDLKTNNNILLGKNIIISGNLFDENGNNLNNKGIVVYIDGIFIKTLITNDNGFFKEFLLAKFPGNREIKCVYEGDWQYEKSSGKTNVNIIGEVEEVKKESSADDIGDQLEKIVKMYEKGFLTDDEFKKAKQKIING